MPGVTKHISDHEIRDIISMVLQVILEQKILYMDYIYLKRVLVAM